MPGRPWSFFAMAAHPLVIHGPKGGLIRYHRAQKDAFAILQNHFVILHTDFVILLAHAISSQADFVRFPNIIAISICNIAI